MDSATENAKLNGIHNCKFICGDVFEVLDSMHEVPEVLIVDPPRAGITPKAMDKLIRYDVNQTSKIGKRRVGKECRSRWSPYH